ncbi:MAG: haloacid dehalogenase-like hydrolase, partial [Victivallales bacterium]|nr:haloacid dehalogenase-like hydrolase [Victivallales bacterium]
MKKKQQMFLMYGLIVLGLAMFSGCAHRPLALWNDDAPAKTALVNYVKDVTAKCSPDFIPPAERVAVFDFDGTLFLETDPTYFDWLLFEHRVLEDPNYKATEEQIAAAKDSRNGKFPKLDSRREQMVSEAYQGMSLQEFDVFIRRFMQEEQPGFIGLRRGDAYYKPMVEVVEFLVRHGFTVYVISGTDRLTVRPLTDTLRLPPSQVIGSDSTIVATG